MIDIFFYDTAFNGNKIEDIYVFRLFLDVGYIEDRHGILRSAGEDYTENITKAGNDLREIKKKISEGEDLRIWSSNNPAEKCGLYFIMKEIKDLHNRVYVVNLPDYYNKGNNLYFYNNWGEVCSDEFDSLLEEKEVGNADIVRSAGKWRELIKERAPLRVVINGDVFSADADFYDNLIPFPEDEFTPASIIGKVSMIGLRIPQDTLIFRLRQLIYEKKISIIKEEENFYISSLKCI